MWSYVSRRSANRKSGARRSKSLHHRLPPKGPNPPISSSQSLNTEPSNSHGDRGSSDEAPTSAVRFDSFNRLRTPLTYLTGFLYFFASSSSCHCSSSSTHSVVISRKQHEGSIFTVVKSNDAIVAPVEVLRSASCPVVCADSKESSRTAPAITPGYPGGYTWSSSLSSALSLVIAHRASLSTRTDTEWALAIRIRPSTVKRRLQCAWSFAASSGGS